MTQDQMSSTRIASANGSAGTARRPFESCATYRAPARVNRVWLLVGTALLCALLPALRPLTARADVTNSAAQGQSPAR